MRQRSLSSSWTPGTHRRCGCPYNGIRRLKVDGKSATNFFRAEISAQDERRHASALVQLANGVFDVLAQQVPLFGRHVPVAAALFEIGRHGGTDRHIGGTIGLRRFAARQLARRCALLGALRIREVRRIWTGKRDRQHQCNPGRSHDRPRFFGRFVPFVTRQPATSGT
ncbi:hypothetical protein F01_210157 [Burkholderia cenocepacia]|nr:hypothetical protein F01_210157 [Burkholderia cenocepacia]